MNDNHASLIQHLFPEVMSLTQEIYQQGFDFSAILPEIKSIHFELMKSPEESLTQFNSLYAVVQAHQSRITEIVIVVRAEKQVWMNFKSRVAEVFNRCRNLLLSNAEDIKALKNQELREAAIGESLSDIVTLQNTVAKALADLDYLIEICTMKKDDLDRANVNMSRQQKVVESLIGLGYLSGRPHA